MTKSLISDKEKSSKSNDATVPILNPDIRNKMTDLIRAHAQTANRQAIHAEFEALLGQHDALMHQLAMSA